MLIEVCVFSFSYLLLGSGCYYRCIIKIDLFIHTILNCLVLSHLQSLLFLATRILRVAKFLPVDPLLIVLYTVTLSVLVHNSCAVEPLYTTEVKSTF